MSPTIASSPGTASVRSRRCRSTSQTGRRRPFAGRSWPRGHAGPPRRTGISRTADLDDAVGGRPDRDPADGLGDVGGRHRLERDRRKPDRAPVGGHVGDRLHGLEELSGARTIEYGMPDVRISASSSDDFAREVPGVDLVRSPPSDEHLGSTTDDARDARLPQPPPRSAGAESRSRRTRGRNRVLKWASSTRRRRPMRRREPRQEPFARDRVISSGPRRERLASVRRELGDDLRR